MKLNRFHWMGIVFFLTLVVFLIMSGYKEVDSSYPDMWSRYAGFVKPINNFADYNGTCLYSTNFTTCYLGAYVSSTTYDTRVNANEGGGSHYGVDMVGTSTCNQTNIRAAAAGEIVAVINNWVDTNQAAGGTDCGNNQRLGFRGWGNYIIVRHDDVPTREGYGGTSYTIYAHLASVEDDVQVGQKVLRGTVLGTFGSTGASTGPHLHFQVDKNFSDVTHPYYASYCDPSVPTGAPNYLNCTIDTVANQKAVRDHTFNPLQYVQKHLVSMNFAGNGACAQYFNGELGAQPSNFQQCTGFNFENTIDHEWLTGGPTNYQTDNFSARWIGEIFLPSQRSWIFYITDDDIAKVWIDNQVILDDWTVNSPSIPETWTVFVPSLRAGSHIVKVEYKEVPSNVLGSDNATMQLAWQPSWSIDFPAILKQSSSLETPEPTSTPITAYTICEPNETVLDWTQYQWNNNQCILTTQSRSFFLYHPNGSADADVFHVNYTAPQCGATVTLYLENTPEQGSSYFYRFEVYNSDGTWRENGIDPLNSGVWSRSYILDGGETLDYFMRVYSEAGSGYSSTNTYQVRYYADECNTNSPSQ